MVREEPALEVTFELRKGRPSPGGDLGPKFGGHRGKNYKGPQNREILGILRSNRRLVWLDGSNREQLRRYEREQGARTQGPLEVIVKPAFGSDCLEESSQGFGKRCERI